MPPSGALPGRRPGGLHAGPAQELGADEAVEVAVEHALADSIRSGGARPVTQKDLERARKEISASTRPWFATAHNYALYANQDGTYDDLLTYIRANKLL